MPDEFEAVGKLAEAEFANFGPTLKAAGVDADKAWQAVEGSKAWLEHAADECEAAITAALDDPYLPEEARHLKIRQARDIYEAAEKQHRSSLTGGIEILQSVLELAARSDLNPAENPAERQLIREELRLKLAGMTQPASDGQGGRPFHGGKSTYQALMEIVQSNPGRYAPEVAAFGADLLTAAGESAFAKDLHANIVKITAGTTPKARAAREALNSLAKVQAHANTTIPRAARARIERAAAPRQTSQIRPDTIRPSR